MLQRPRFTATGASTSAWRMSRLSAFRTTCTALASVGAKRRAVYTHLKTLLLCASVCLMALVSLLEGVALLLSTSSIPLFILSISLFIVGVSVAGVGLAILLERYGSSSKGTTRGRST